MFERYTEGARRILFFSRHEASQLGYVSIEPEHVLLGLLRSRDLIVGRILRDADVSEDKVRAEAREKARDLPPPSSSIEIPFATTTKRVLQYAAEEADRLDHSRIGAEHLLLGVLRERGTGAERILAQAGLLADPVREHIREVAVSPVADANQPPTRAEALGAIERISMRLNQLAGAERADVSRLIEQVREELNLVREALKG